VSLIADKVLWISLVICRLMFTVEKLVKML
jgi:hypothetical protein